MRILDGIAELRSWRREGAPAGTSVGFVPTMGYLHEGHLSLVRASVAENDRTVVSIFVNPAQFGPEMDLDRYPRDLDRDRELLVGAGVDAIFHPTPDLMYPPGFRTWVEVEEMTESLDGGSRPGYFRGIATVVLKLFHLVEPTRAYFGRKDIQQAMMIRRMVRDLDLDVDVRDLPTVREADGLAMSSRNAYLDEDERVIATGLNRALEAARAVFERGERDATVLLKVARAVLESEPRLVIDYVDLVDLEDFRPLARVDRPATLALACVLGGTRLIDNAVLEPR